MTENNNESMKTVVETFIIEETAELIYDGEKLEKWNSLVSELGLNGQTSICKKEKSPIPFLFMKKELVNIFEALCPAKSPIETYSMGAIPLEIMELVALSKREGYFDKIQVWYDDKSPDPVCVGLVFDTEEHRKQGYEWYMNKFLIGKWGDVKQSFEELKSRAIARFKKTKKNEIEQAIKMHQRQLEDLDNIAIDSFGVDSNLPF